MSQTFLSHNEKLIHSLYQVGAIKIGEFILPSGSTSSIDVDLRQIISYPIILQTVANLMWETVRLCQFDLICGVPYTALPIATCLSLQNNIPMIMRRKEKNLYGTCKQVQGNYHIGQSCLLIEDVITTGNNVIETAEDLEEEGLIIYDVAIFIDKEGKGKENLMKKNYIVHSALTLTNIVHGLISLEVLSDAQRELIMQHKHTHE
jgi:orotate phosphoribosyltransferase